MAILITKVEHAYNSASETTKLVYNPSAFMVWILDLMYTVQLRQPNWTKISHQFLQCGFWILCIIKTLTKMLLPNTKQLINAKLYTLLK